MWYRVFALSDAEIQPAELLEHLRQAGLDVQAHFRGDEKGWFEAELVHDDLALTLSRFLVSEEGVRAELSSWAAWVELQETNPHRDYLMQQLISVQQMFAAEVPDGELGISPGKVGLELCRHLAAKLGGSYQVDGNGFFSSDGTLLIPE